MRIVVGLFIAAATAWAGNAVSFVASTGNDANDCTRPNPCRTFATAAEATNLNGTVRAVDAGEYGPFVVLSAMTFDGGDSGAVIQGTIPEPMGVSINILSNAGTANVTLRNLVIRPGLTAGSTTYALLTLSNNAAVLNLENVRIEMGDSVNSGGIFSTPASATKINLRNVTITGGLIGIQLAGATGASLPALTADRLSITNTAYALLMQDYAVSLRDSVFTGNGAGITVTSNVAATTAFIERCEMSFNSIGLQVTGGGGGSTVRLGDSVITGNTTGVSTSSGGTIISFRTNLLAGNVTDGALALTTSLK